MEFVLNKGGAFVNVIFTTMRTNKRINIDNMFSKKNRPFLNDRNDYN